MQDHPQLRAALSRRRLIAAAFALGAGRALPARAAPAPDAIARLRTKRLIVLALVGGNDGLNTLVPVRDPLYRRLRPTLALPAGELLPLDGEFALHPALRETTALYQRGELAVVPDVGYPRPNLSHFESAAIWDSADPLQGTAASAGWWGELVMRQRGAFEAAQLDAAALSFDSAAAFAAGQRVPVLRARQDVAELFAPGPARLAPGALRSHGTARELAEMLADGERVRERVAQRLRHAQRPSWRPYEQPIDVQVQLTDWFLSNGVAVPLLRLNLDGFDTHTELLPRHGALMALLDRTLAGLRERLRAAGLWDDTVVLVHSEFGRRPAENGHGGTDHGTAGPLLLAGGRVQGGVHGARAALDALDHEGNPRFATDFRRVYGTIASGLFGLPAEPFAAADRPPLAIRLA